MPITYVHDGTPPILRIVVTGVVSLEQKGQTVNAMLSDPALPARVPVLIDVNGAPDLLTVDDLHGISKLVDKLSERFGERVGILNVVPGHVSMSHLVVAVAQTRRLRVFMSETDAVEWLNAL